MEIRINKRFFAFLLALALLLAFPILSYAESVGPYQIEVYGPAEPQTEQAAIEIVVRDTAGVGWAQIVAITTYDGYWYDLTESVELYGKAFLIITGNTDVVVKVIAPDGTEYTDSRRAELFAEPAQPDRGVGGDVMTTAFREESAADPQPETASTGSTSSEDVGGDESSDAVEQAASEKKTSMEQFPQNNNDSDAGAIPPMNTDGTSTVIDNAVVDGQEREFFTMQTPLGNVFYLIVDRNKDTQNVYFLNAVTEQDLLSLAEDESWTEDYPAQNAAIPDPEPDASAASDTPDASEAESSDPEPGDEAEPPPDEGEGGSPSPIIIIGAFLVVAVGVGYYIKIVKPKRELDNADDLEDIEYLEEDEDDYDPDDDAEDDQV